MNGECVSADVELSGNPRRLFRQRHVLDTMRTCLELSDELLVEMHSKELLTDDELETLTQLSWPKNRNELLQILVRMPWTDASFKEFCNVLRQTETSVLNRMLADKLTDATFEISAPDAGHVVRPSTAPGGVFWSSHWDDDAASERATTPSLDSLLEALPSRDRCAVQAVIHDRDGRIAKLMMQTEQLEHDLLWKEHALEDARIKYSLTERLLTEWLASLTLPSDAQSTASYDSDGSEPTFKAGLDEVAAILERQSEHIEKLHNDNSELRQQLDDVERRATADRGALTGRLQQVEADADAVRRDKDQLAGQLETTRNELDRIRRTVGSSGDSADEQERSGSRMKSKKKDRQSGETGNQAKKATKTWLRQRKLSIDATSSGVTPRQTSRRGSIVEDGKKADRTTTVASTCSRLVVRRASIATVTPTASRAPSLKLKSSEH